MAELGFRSMAEMIGHVEMLDTRAAIDHWKASGLDLTPILAAPRNPYGQSLHNTKGQDHGLDKALDVELIRQAHDAIVDRLPVAIDLPIRNVNRSVGTMLGHEITKRWKGAGLPDGTIDIHLTGSAGQSFGAFVPGRGHDAPRRRRQRLPRQGPVGRADHRPPASGGAVRRRGAGRRRQRHRLRGDRRRDLPPRGGRGALLRPQLRRPRRRRGNRRPRVRVHDRRAASSCSARPGATSAPGCRVASPTSGTPTACCRPASTRDGRPRGASATTATSCATIVARHQAFTDSAVAARLLARWDDAVSRVRQGDAARLQAGPRRDARRRGRRPRRAADVAATGDGGRRHG